MATKANDTFIDEGLFRRSWNKTLADKHSGKVVDVITFFEDPYYLGKRCNPKRFLSQKILLKVFYNIPIDNKVKLDFGHLGFLTELEWLEMMAAERRTNWTPDGGPYTVIVLYVGQRGGKSWLGSGIAWYECHRWLETVDPYVTIPQQRGSEWIAPDSPIEVKMVATSEDNAKAHIFKEAKAFGKISPYLQAKIGSERNIMTLQINLPRNLTLIAGSSTAKAIRGGTGLAGIGDEFPWMIDTEGHKGGEEVYTALENTLKTLKGPMIAIGSPASVDDILYRMGQDAMAGKTKNVLFFNLPTWIYDPSQSESDYDDVKARDFERWERDFAAKPSLALEPYFKQGTVVKKFFTGLHVPGDYEAPQTGASLDVERAFHNIMREYILSDEYPHKGNCEYILTGDPAEKNDAFGYSLMHKDGKGRIEIDLLGRYIPDPKYGKEIEELEVKTFMGRVTDKFEVEVYIDDGYSFPGMRGHIRDKGAKIIEQILDVKKANLGKSAIYTGQAKCWWLPQAWDEMMSIEIKNAKKLEFRRVTGKPGHGDIACALLQGLSFFYDPEEADDYGFV